MVTELKGKKPAPCTVIRAPAGPMLGLRVTRGAPPRKAVPNNWPTVGWVSVRKSAMIKLAEMSTRLFETTLHCVPFHQ